ncbi:MAG: chorismate synthase, partial [Eubacteriaceae bacterium]|nr:chorismate synthase [Eubacteriaceae bacterium]
LSALLFAIPAVKGVEFGSGFDIATMRGSEANDPFFIEGGQVRTRTNCNGGINGGITNGMPVVFRVAFKPTPSIARKQYTIDMEKQENTTIAIEGRHDPCIVLRAAPVVEAVTALCILDLSL